MKYSVTVTKGTTTFEIEAPNEEAAKYLADEWYNERKFEKEEVKPIKDEKPYDRLKTLDNFNNKIRQENIKKANDEKMRIEVAQAKIETLMPRIKTLLDVARKCINPIPGIGEFFVTYKSGGVYHDKKDEGNLMLKIYDPEYTGKYDRNIYVEVYKKISEYSDFYKGYSYIEELTIGYYSNGEFKSDVNRCNYLNVLEFFVNNYESFEKDFYDCIDKALNK